MPHYKIPFVFVVERGPSVPSMIKDFFLYPWVVNPPLEFASEDELIALIPTRIIQPAEENLVHLQKLLKEHQGSTGTGRPGH